MVHHFWGFNRYVCTLMIESFQTSFHVVSISLRTMYAVQVDEDKEARKLEAARAVLAGRSFTEGEEDPFEGLGPQEIQAYIDKALQGVSHSDPFEVGLVRFLTHVIMQLSHSGLVMHCGLHVWRAA